MVAARWCDVVITPAKASSRDTFTIRFDRTTAIAPTLVEFLSLDLSDATAGRYTLRVEISDLGSGQKAARNTEFSIR